MGAGASVNAGGTFSAWSAAPEAGKLQIPTLILMLEWATAAKGRAGRAPAGSPAGCA